MDLVRELRSRTGSYHLENQFGHGFPSTLDLYRILEPGFKIFQRARLAGVDGRDRVAGGDFRAELAVEDQADAVVDGVGGFLAAAAELDQDPAEGLGIHFGDETLGFRGPDRLMRGE